MALFTAQTIGNYAGRLDAHGASGGPEALATQPFFLSVNSSVNFLVPTLELPGGLWCQVTTSSLPRSSTHSTPGVHAGHVSAGSDCARAGHFQFQAHQHHGVAGINDDLSAGGLVAGVFPRLREPAHLPRYSERGNHSFPTPLDIGTVTQPFQLVGQFGRLNMSYLPTITVCKTDPATGLRRARVRLPLTSPGFDRWQIRPRWQDQGTDSARSFSPRPVFP